MSALIYRHLRIEMTEEGSKQELKIKVIPSEEKPPDKRIQKIKYELPKIPSNMFFLGRCGSGKSCCLYSLLNEGYTHNGKSIFDEVVVYLGTLDAAESFKKLPCKNIMVLHEFDADDFRQYLDDLKKYQMERLEKHKRPHNVCIVFDDFIGNELVKSKNGKPSPLQTLILTSRHECNATVMFCSQTYKHASFTTPTIRNNINYYFLFTIARNDLEKVAEEHSNDLTKDEFMDLYHEIHKQPYQFMIVDYKKMCFRRGFTEVVHSFHEEKKLEHSVDGKET
jgi:hypothetical protein